MHTHTKKILTPNNELCVNLNITLSQSLILEHVQHIFAEVLKNNIWFHVLKTPLWSEYYKYV